MTSINTRPTHREDGPSRESLDHKGLEGKNLEGKDLGGEHLSSRNLGSKNLGGRNLDCGELDQLIQQVREEHQQLLDLLKDLEALREAKQHSPALLNSFKYLRDQYQQVRKVISIIYSGKSDTTEKTPRSSRLPAFVGMISGPPDLSTRYKEILSDHFEEKLRHIGAANPTGSRSTHSSPRCADQ